MHHRTKFGKKPTNGRLSLAQKHVASWSLLTTKHGSSIFVYHNINPIFLSKINYQLGPLLVYLKHTSKAQGNVTICTTICSYMF